VTRFFGGIKPPDFFLCETKSVNAEKNVKRGVWSCDEEPQQIPSR